VFLYGAVWYWRGRRHKGSTSLAEAGAVCHLVAIIDIYSFKAIILTACKK